MKLLTVHSVPGGKQYGTPLFYFSICKGLFRFQWSNAENSGFEIRDIRLHPLRFSERPNHLLPPGQQIIAKYWRTGNWIFQKVKAL